MDYDPTAAFNSLVENEELSSEHSSAITTCKLDLIEESKTLSLTSSESNSFFAFDEFEESDEISGFEPVLGGELKEKAIWVDESNCIGCQYCVHVANNTFMVDENYGRARVMRQDGDTLETVQEAVDTCPVNCMHWVDFEDLETLESSLNRDMFQSLGKLPRINRY